MGLCGVIGAIVSRKQAEWRRALKAGLILAAAGALWREAAIRFLNVPSDVTPFASAAFILSALIGLLIRDCWRDVEKRSDNGTETREATDVELKDDEGKALINSASHYHSALWSRRLSVLTTPDLPAYRSVRIRILLVIAVYSFVSILRAILNITGTGSYTPFLLPALIIVILYLLFRVAPELLARTDSIRVNIRRVAMLMMALLIIGMGANSAMRLRRLNTYSVSASRGSFITVPEIGEPLQSAVRFVEERSAPDDYVMAAPQATTINFLAARRYPLREEIIHPGFLAGEKELEAIERIEFRKPSLILIVNFDTSEFNDRAFGIDYNQGLMRWINENYHFAARFDSAHSQGASLGDKPFFILAYERNQDRGR